MTGKRNGGWREVCAPDLIRVSFRFMPSNVVSPDFRDIYGLEIIRG